MRSTEPSDFRFPVAAWVCFGLMFVVGRGLAQEPTAPLPQSMATVAEIENALVAAIEKAEQSVVAIARTRTDRVASAQTDPLQLGGMFPLLDSAENADFIPTFFGSGVVISEDGFIVTCAHVLDDPRRNDYFVWLDKRSYRARVVGKAARVLAADPFSDLAVLKIDARDLQPIQMGNPEELRKGQFVLALGNPDATARDGVASSSWGIISNLRRLAPAETAEPTAIVKESIHQFGTLIQTDARLSLGSSGGALVDLRGRMIGLTTSLAALRGNEDSAGFAIATDALFLRVVESLKLGHLPEYGFLGIQPDDLNAADRERGFSGAKVAAVLTGLPGDEAGLKAEDVIVQVNRETVDNKNELFRELSKIDAGEWVELQIQRPNLGRRGTQRISVNARLSKKYVGTHRPGYSIHPPPTWRGMLVDYATAIPSELMRGGFQSQRIAAKVAVLTVDPGTAAWNAGLRPGDGILEVESRGIESPEDFHAQVLNSVGPLSITVQRNDGRRHVLTVAAELP